MPAQHLASLSPPELRPCSPISIVIVTYNSARVLAGLLDSLPAGLAGIDDAEVVVVDNDSADRSVEIARAHPIRPRIISTGRNAGYAAGINAATATIAPDRSVLILNPDIRLQPGAARTLLEPLNDPSVGVTAPRILNEDGSTAFSLRREPSVLTGWSEALLGGLAIRMGLSEVISDPALYAKGGPVEWVTGAALAVSPQARRIVGDWDESFFLYSEEVDYLRKVRDSGFFVLAVPSAEMMHIGGDYLDNPRLSALLAHNRIRYFRRHHGPLATAAFQFSIVIGAAMRAMLGPTHRAVLRAALAPAKPPFEIPTGAGGQV
ncbi:glycosyltransferase [Microvirga flavescens]|uniref:glycosyltransferase n=1 Tax=Microvirga flavescens TaxID=2249811 RepID=UPI001FE1D218|nr:glycosyltransferase family 2 protein [Microvirga flavescens]